MKRRWVRWCSLALLGVVLASGGLALRSGARAPASEQPEKTSPGSGEVLPPATNLRLVASRQAEGGPALLDPAAKEWEAARPTAILLNRTPRIYRTEPVLDHPIPALEVRAVRQGDQVWIRLRWTDATRNAPQAPQARENEKGEGQGVVKLPKRPTGHTASFADAAAIMVPQDWHGPGFPSLQMGDKKNPVRLFYWNASHGAEELTATGRATPGRTGRTFAHQAVYAEGRWTLTAQLPDISDGYPLAFAVWDGEHQDRDGLKWFSIWYVLQTP
jgi:hypothetical protein